MTRLKAKEDLNVLNDKKGERVERMDEWMNEKCRGGGWFLFIDLLVTLGEMSF